MRSIWILTIVLAFAAGSVLTGAMAYAAGDMNGQPFEALWDAIHGLEAVTCIDITGGAGLCDGTDAVGLTTSQTIYSFSDGFDNYDGSGTGVLGHGELSISTTDMVAYDGTMKNLYVHMPAGIAAGTSITLTLEKGPIGFNLVGTTALTCTVLPGETSCTNTTDQVSMVAGEHFRLFITGDGSSGIISAAMEYSSP